MHGIVPRRTAPRELFLKTGGRFDSKDEGGGVLGAGATSAVAGRARALWSALARQKTTLEDSAKLAPGRGQWTRAIQSAPHGAGCERVRVRILLVDKEELEDNEILQANDGYICSTVKAESTERYIANVSIWSAGKTPPSCRLGIMKGTPGRPPH